MAGLSFLSRKLPVDDFRNRKNTRSWTKSAKIISYIRRPILFIACKFLPISEKMAPTSCSKETRKLPLTCLMACAIKDSFTFDLTFSQRSNHVLRKTQYNVSHQRKSVSFQKSFRPIISHQVTAWYSMGGTWSKNPVTSRIFFLSFSPL